MGMSDSEQENYHTRETLLEKIRNQHDDKSWEDFVFYYKHFIYIICRRMNLAHHDAEEVVQKVLVKVWNTPLDLSMINVVALEAGFVR